METWPASLPKPQLKFNAQLRSGIADDQEQINSMRTRTYPERESNFTLKLTQAQFETLRTFYETTLNGGGMLFEADWLTEAGFAFHRLRFLKPFEANSKGGGIWEIKINLKIIAGVPFEDGSPAYWPCPPPPIPDPPANVQASDGTFTDKVQVTWTASSGATSYEVYRSDTEGGTKSLKGSPETNSFDDTTAVAPTVYYYWVKAKNESGTSDFSSFDTGWRDEGLLEESGYVYGGYGTGNLQDCDQYTPDTWVSKSNMPSPARRALAASTIGNSGYVYGGYGTGNLQDCDQYTPDTWVSKSNMPTPARRYLAASTIGSNGYVYGGYGTGNLQDCDQYTPDTWVSKSDMPTPARDSLAASTIGSSGYIYGGYGTGNLQDCDQYTPDTWVSKSNMPSPGRHYLAASTIGSNGYVYGGYGTGNLQDCDQYTPDTWVSKSNMPTPARDSLAASTIGSSGYIYGGSGSYLQDCDEYTPDTWVSKNDMPAPGRGWLAASTI